MQARNYVSAYNAHDLDVGSSGFSWHLLNRNANYVEKNGFHISLRSVSMGQCLSYDKEMLRQIMQNHDSMFRYQVQELHRLYRKQKELMNEMRLRKISLRHPISLTSGSIHSFSHAHSDISQATPSWLTLDSVQQLPKFITSDYFHDGNEVKCQNRTISIQLSANVYLGDQMEHFECRHSEALKLTCDSPKKIWPATDSTTATVKTEDLSSLDLNEGKKNCCLIDLNEPVHNDSPPSSPKCLTQTNTRCLEIKHNESGLLNTDDSSDGTISSPVIIDLNSVPSGCFPEIEVNLEQTPAIKKEPTEAPDKCVEDHHPFVNIKLLKPETDIDLNTDAVTNHHLIELVENEDLVGPVSPENKECSPPRGKSEGNIQLEVPTVELDTLAAKTLVLISTYGAHTCLSWFAEIASVAGDLKDFEAVSVGLSSEKNDALNLSSRVFKKEKETGTLLLSTGSRKSNAKGIRHRRDSRTEVLTCQSKDHVDAKGYFDTGSSRRKRGCAKPRKYSKVDKDPDPIKKKSAGFMWKHPGGTGTKQGILQSWGKMKKREVGLRRKASVFPVIR